MPKDHFQAIEKVPDRRRLETICSGPLWNLNKWHQSDRSRRVSSVKRLPVPIIAPFMRIERIESPNGVVHEVIVLAERDTPELAYTYSSWTD